MNYNPLEWITAFLGELKLRWSTTALQNGVWLFGGEDNSSDCTMALRGGLRLFGVTSTLGSGPRLFRVDYGFSESIKALQN